MRQTDNFEQEVILAQITGVLGVKGWLKVRSFSLPLENIFNYTHWRLSLPDGSSQMVELEVGKRHGKGLIAKLKDVADRDLASSLVGAEVSVPSQELPELQEGDYYWYQLESLLVVNTQGVCFGKVSHLMETGANDVLVVKPSAESIDDSERLIPYLPDKTIVDVQLDSGKILVDWDVQY